MLNSNFLSCHDLNSHPMISHIVTRYILIHLIEILNLFDRERSINYCSGYYLNNFIFYYYYYSYLPRITSSVHSWTVINEGPANEVLIVFKAPICSTQHQTLSDIMLNYDNHVVLAMVERHLLKVPVLGIEPLTS